MKSTDKKRVLWVGESSFVNSGYGLYTKELLPRLVASNKYEVAELSCYGNPADPRNKTLGWRVYGNMPLNDQEGQAYQSNNYNQFGLWRLDETLVDFKPHYVLGIRDHWMDSHILHSPLRRFFSTVMIPSTDSAPQLEEWIADYITVDTALTYTDYSKKVLEEESGGLIKVRESVGVGIEFDIFKPVRNKKEHKGNYWLDPNCVIVGTVMRNQRRKLFPDLIESFAKFCQQYPKESSNVYLYMHTSYPDLGWDLPRLIRESGISHKLLFTYLCPHCRSISVLPFQDAKTTCFKCGCVDCSMPNVYNGVTREQLAEIYNLMDVYVQYANCEGCGFGQLESAACGVPFMAVNYSAMESVLQLLQGIPINVYKYYREPESHAYRVYPDNDDFIKKLAQFIQLPEQMRLKKGRDSYNLCHKHYNWELVASKWIDALDNTPIALASWNDPPQYHQPNLQTPDNLSNLDFVRWCFVNVLGDPSKINSYWESKYLRSLNYGAAIEGVGGLNMSDMSDPMFMSRPQQFTRDNFIQFLLAYRERCNQCEYMRTNYRIENASPFIQLAH